MSNNVNKRQVNVKLQLSSCVVGFFRTNTHTHARTHTYTHTHTHTGTGTGTRTHRHTHTHTHTQTHAHTRTHTHTDVLISCNFCRRAQRDLHLFSEHEQRSTMAFSPVLLMQISFALKSIWSCLKGSRMLSCCLTLTHTHTHTHTHAPAVWPSGLPRAASRPSCGKLFTSTYTQTHAQNNPLSLGLSVCLSSSEDTYVYNAY